MSGPVCTSINILPARTPRKSRYRLLRGVLHTVTVSPADDDYCGLRIGCADINVPAELGEQLRQFIGQIVATACIDGHWTVGKARP